MTSQLELGYAPWSSAQSRCHFEAFPDPSPQPWPRRLVLPRGSLGSGHSLVQCGGGEAARFPDHVGQACGGATSP